MPPITRAGVPPEIQGLPFQLMKKGGEPALIQYGFATKDEIARPDFYAKGQKGYYWALILGYHFSNNAQGAPLACGDVIREFSKDKVARYGLEAVAEIARIGIPATHLYAGRFLETLGLLDAFIKDRQTLLEAVDVVIRFTGLDPLGNSKTSRVYPPGEGEAGWLPQFKRFAERFSPLAKKYRLADIARLAISNASNWTEPGQVPGAIERFGIAPLLELHRHAGDDTPAVLERIETMVMRSTRDSAQATLGNDLYSTWTPKQILGFASSLAPYTKKETSLALSKIMYEFYSNEYNLAGMANERKKGLDGKLAYAAYEKKLSAFNAGVAEKALKISQKAGVHTGPVLGASSELYYLVWNQEAAKEEQLRERLLEQLIGIARQSAGYSETVFAGLTALTKSKTKDGRHVIVSPDDLDTKAAKLLEMARAGFTKTAYLEDHREEIKRYGIAPLAEIIKQASVIRYRDQREFGLTKGVGRGASRVLNQERPVDDILENLNPDLMLKYGTRPFIAIAEIFRNTAPAVFGLLSRHETPLERFGMDVLLQYFNKIAALPARPQGYAHEAIWVIDALSHLDGGSTRLREDIRTPEDFLKAADLLTRFALTPIKDENHPHAAPENNFIIYYFSRYRSMGLTSGHGYLDLFAEIYKDSPDRLKNLERYLNATVKNPRRHILAAGRLQENAAAGEHRGVPGSLWPGAEYGQPSERC